MKQISKSVYVKKEWVQDEMTYSIYLCDMFLGWEETAFDAIEAATKIAQERGEEIL